MADGAIRLVTVDATDIPTPPAGRVWLFFDSLNLDHLSIKDESGTVIDLQNALNYTDEKAQDAVGNILTDTADIDFTYDDSSPEITAILTTTGVIAATYGSASSIPVFAVDSKGRITSVLNTPIVITASQVSDFAEAAQDAVAPAFVDSASVDFTYNDGANTVTADVVPSGVNHDGLQNYDANDHIDHTTVSILTSGGSGLSGGGTIAANRSLVVDIAGQTNDPRPDMADEVMVWDLSANLRKRSSIKRLQYTNPDVLNIRYSDFIAETTGGLTATTGGAGSSSQAGTYGVDLTERAQGVVQLDTGTTATGRAALHSAQIAQLFPGSAKQRFGCRIAPEALSVAGVEQFTVYAGLLDNTGAGDVTDGFYFRYTDGVNAGRWEIVTAAGGTRYAEDSGVTASVNYSVFEVEVDEAATQADFYIDGTLVGSITSVEAGAAWPVAPGNAYGFGFKIEKAVGATVRNLSCDWYYFEFDRSTAR